MIMFFFSNFHATTNYYSYIFLIGIIMLKVKVGHTDHEHEATLVRAFANKCTQKGGCNIIINVKYFLF